MINNQQQVIELLSSINRSLAISAQSDLKVSGKDGTIKDIESLKVDSSDLSGGESNKISDMGKLFGGDKSWKFK
uniref:Uncharacterized protein n=1 Tax=Vibrio crassostreae TaxID=246167 RepID=A0A0H3ZPM9_9VIBR|nr:hypothetical protein [Vibrio crassostreae]